MEPSVKPADLGPDDPSFLILYRIKRLLAEHGYDPSPVEIGFDEAGAPVAPLIFINGTGVDQRGRPVRHRLVLNPAEE